MTVKRLKSKINLKSIAILCTDSESERESIHNEIYSLIILLIKELAK